MLRTISNLMILLLVGSICSPFFLINEDAPAFESREASNSPTNPYVVPTFENYSGERTNLSMSQFHWNDYTNFVSDNTPPILLHFSERMDNSLLILVNPRHNGQMMNNETFGSGDSILLNIDRDGTYLNSKVLDSGEASGDRRYGFTVFVDSPDQSNLSVLGTFPAESSSYGILNNTITITGGQYGSQWSGYEKDAFVVVKLNSTTFEMEKFETAQVPSVLGPNYAPSCKLGLYEEVFVNNSEFAFVLELTGYTNGAGAQYRCESYDFNGTSLTQSTGRGVKSNFVVRASHELEILDIERISSRYAAGSGAYDGSEGYYGNHPPVFTSNGGWAYVQAPQASFSGAYTGLYYSNYNKTVTGVIALCDGGSASYDIQSDLSDGILNLCSEYDTNTQEYNVSLRKLNLSDGSTVKIHLGKGEVESHGIIPLSPDRILLSLSSTYGFDDNHTTYFGTFILEINPNSGHTVLADSNLDFKFHVGGNQQLTPSYRVQRTWHYTGSGLLLMPEGIDEFSRLKFFEIDSDLDGSPDRSDIFPLDRSQTHDSDNDGYGDNITGTDGDACPTTYGTSTVDRFGCEDTDSDGHSNLADQFPLDDSQYIDSDSDGFGDNETGFRGDDCPEIFGESDQDRFGCEDTDGDGWSDENDIFSYDSSQWSDWDGDGFGDQFNGFEGDACPADPGNSTKDRFGCVDSDGDGWSDEGDALPFNPTQWSDRDGDGFGDNQEENATLFDIFPADGTQWNDTDGDGHGDNPYGTEGDWFPDDPTRWQDTDRDGVADEDDAFPNEKSQTMDTDGDGYGDDANGSNPDAFPNDAEEWSDTDGDGIGNNADAFPFDPSQQTDSDGDGFGDNERGTGADKFPSDSTQWSDIDGDGYGDNSEGINPDAFITDPTQWADTDGDGYGDNPTGRLADAFIEDPTQWIDEDDDGYGDNQSGNNPDPFLFDFDNDGYNDSIDPLPKLASPGDLDNDGVLDENDLFPEDFREWADNDDDGIGDNADTDDDNDGWSDADELREGTDPFSSSEQPVDSFEIVIPGTAVGLGAWDLIGIFGGVPLFAWIGFGFITRNGRTAKYEEKLRAANTRDELESVARQWEYSLMLRMLGPHQGIRLERLRAELDDVFERQNQTLSSLEQSEYNQTQLVQNEMNQNEKEVPEINLKPDIDAVGNPDENGYEWITSEDGANYYRTIGSGDEWIKFEN